MATFFMKCIDWLSAWSAGSAQKLWNMHVPDISSGVQGKLVEPGLDENRRESEAREKVRALGEGNAANRTGAGGLMDASLRYRLRDVLLSS